MEPMIGTKNGRASRPRSALSNIVRMNNVDIAVPGEVLNVEGDDLSDAVGFHNGYQPGVMNLNTHYVMLHH